MIMSTAIPTSPPRSARSSRSGHRRERARRHSILCNAVHSAPGIPKSARYEPLPKRGIATACSPRRSRPCATSNRSGTRTTRPTVKCPPRSRPTPPWPRPGSATSTMRKPPWRGIATSGPSQTRRRRPQRRFRSRSSRRSTKPPGAPLVLDNTESAQVRSVAGPVAPRYP
jgi:hypothetical protein